MADTGIMIHMREDMRNNREKEARPPRRRRENSSAGGIATDSLSYDDENKKMGH